ncbi:MAG: protein-glutamate O-methyltransferase CheR [Acidobacteriota bacterium]
MHRELPALTAEELALFNELLIERFGLHFPEHKREILASRLQPRLRANHLSRYLDYYLMLQYDFAREKESLIAAITNNESYFFRETSQFEALKNEVLQRLRNENEGGKVRLLSAGCSSGEEPYSLNIFVRGFAFGAGIDAVTIDAVDIDTERLAKAKSAIYRRAALRALTEDQITRYFHRHDDETFELKTIYRRGVDFAVGNILELGGLAGGQPYDVIFCRNVLIYFAEPSLKAAVRNFARALRPGGYLFLGHSESIIGLSHDFTAERLEQCIAYRRVHAAEEAR